MNRTFLIAIPLALLLCLSIFLVARQTAAPIDAQANQKTSQLKRSNYANDARAIWVVRYTLTSPEAIKASVKRAKDAGFTDLLVQVRGRGDAFYDSRVEPRAEELKDQPANFDPLALMVKEGHAAGLRVHAWINTFVVANVAPTLPKLPKHLIYEHPEQLMVPLALARKLYYVNPRSPAYLKTLTDYVVANKDTLEGLYTSPSDDAVKEHLKQIWLDVATRYQVDGLHYDYVRYPNETFDYSHATLERFRAELEPQLAPAEKLKFAQLAMRNPLIYSQIFPERYADFLRAHVSKTVAQIHQAVKARRPDVAISAAVYASADEAFRTRLQDWKSWTKQGWLDIVCPMAYTPDTDVFRRQMVQAVSYSAGRSIWGGIGSWRQPVASTLDKIKAARAVGTNGFVLFSYDSAVQFSALNPQQDYLERVRDGLAMNAP